MDDDAERGFRWSYILTMYSEGKRICCERWADRGEES